jgi:hypothetical protein
LTPLNDLGRSCSLIFPTGEPRVHDRVALDEIELYAEVLSAVAAADRTLTQEELDEILGISPKRQVTIPVGIYLAIEDDHEIVEQALTLVLETFGFDVVHADLPIRGSWFRKFIGSAKELATDPEVEKRLINLSEPLTCAFFYRARQT